MKQKPQLRQLTKTGLKVIIGRSTKCDMSIENPDQFNTVSGSHATIHQTDLSKESGFYIFEDHSTNGSYVNGLHIHKQECVIEITDHVTLGKSYELDLKDVINRFFLSRKTTDKKKTEIKEPQYVSPEPVREPLPETVLGTSSAPEPTSPASTPVKPWNYPSESSKIEAVPAWLWAVFVVGIVVAFAVGCIIGSSF